jgi:hypothetical protein
MKHTDPLLPLQRLLCSESGRSTLTAKVVNRPIQTLVADCAAIASWVGDGKARIQL